MKKLILTLLIGGVIMMSGCEVNNRTEEIEGYKLMSNSNTYYICFTIDGQNYQQSISKELYDKLNDKSISSIEVKFNCDENPLTQNRKNAFNFRFGSTYSK